MSTVDRPSEALARPRSWARAAREILVGGSACVLAILASPLLRGWYRRWGTTRAEARAPIPGDDLIPRPELGYTRAIMIDVPPQRVWPWVAQIGHGRGGFYSYDGLENLFGCQIRSADRVLPEHQEPAVGDLVRLGPKGYPCFAIARVEAPHTFVLAGADPQTGEPPTRLLRGDRGAGATWQWHVRHAGGGQTRLMVRQRLVPEPGQRLMWRLVEPVNFVMERRMLRRIKELAEGAPDRHG